MRLRFLLPGLLLLALLAAAPAPAHLTKAEKLRKSETVIDWYNGKGRWTLRPAYRRCADLRSSRAEDRCYRHRTNLRWHTARAQRLRPKPVIVPLGHRAGWLCIHSREAGWHQGSRYKVNGVSVYWGGLQMTVGWLGLIEGRASDMTPEAQMGAAEHGYRLSGYSSVWLAGQWPRTYPPCAGYFN